MAFISFSKFNAFVADLANKSHNLGADALKVMLTDVAPVAANAVKTDIIEIPASNGYTVGGVAAPISSSVQSGGVYKLIAASSVVFQATGGPLPTFRYAVLYNSTNAKLIGYWDFLIENNVADGNSFTVLFDPSGGVLQVA